MNTNLYKKKLFDMWQKVELARAYSRAALNYNLNNTPPVTRFSIASKIYCTNAAFEIASEAVQLFGAMEFPKSTISKNYLESLGLQ